MPASGRYIVRHLNSCRQPREGVEKQIAALVKSLGAQFGDDAVHVNPWTIKEGERETPATIVTFQSRNGNGHPAKVKPPTHYQVYHTPTDPEVWRKKLAKVEEARQQRLDEEKQKMRDRITHLRKSMERSTWWEPPDWKWLLNRKRRRQAVGHVLARNWRRWTPGKALYAELDAAFVGEKVRRASQVPTHRTSPSHSWRGDPGASAEDYKQYIVSLVGGYLPKEKELPQAVAHYSPLHLGYDPYSHYKQYQAKPQLLNIPVPAPVEPPFGPAEELAEIEYLQSCLVLAEAKKGGAKEESVGATG